MNSLQKGVFCFLSSLVMISLMFVLFYDAETWKKTTIRAMVTFTNLDTTVRNTTMMPNKAIKPKAMKTILFYTKFFGQLPWPHTIGRENNLTDFQNRPCKVAACNFSISKDDISRSDVVIFHAYSTPSPKDMKKLVLKKPKGQMWAWFNEESAIGTSDVSLDKLQNMFELTITHMQDSDIHTLYGEYFKLGEASRAEAEKLYKNRNFAAEKDNLVLWFANNCVSLRLSIVKAITKHIQVDVYGGCQSHFTKPQGYCARRTPECQKVHERYKFFLSFENSNCRGYLTEKYWENALDRNVVPVVIAGSYNKDVLIPGSYIDILDFPHATALARYLKYLDKNDTAYNSYFDWKKKYRYTRETNWICDLCEYLHKDNTTKKDFWDLGKYWGVKENCNADNSRITNSWIKS